jgi:hypothetical protein
MIVDAKLLPPADLLHLVIVKAHVKIDDPVAFRAGEVMMVFVAPAHAEIVRPVGKIDAIQDLHANELFDGTVDCGTADPRIGLSQPGEQIVGGKSLSRLPQVDQAFGDDLTRTGRALAELAES